MAMKSMVCALLLSALGCFGANGTDDASPDAGPVDPTCRMLGRGTPEELAATPRELEEMELLALSISEGLTADQAIYERVTRDVALIRAGNPLAFIRYRPVYDGRGLLVLFDDARTLREIAAETYVPEWDCLNQHYEMQEVHLNDGVTPWALVTFEGRYDLSLVAEDYEALPGVRLAEGNGLVGDGSTICAGIDGDTYQYVFDLASGDCPAGCIDHEYTYYRVSLDGTVDEAGSWSGSVGTRRPEWAELCN